MIDAQTVARIKACKNMYSIGDTARYFNVSKSTVHDIWTGKRHRNVEATEPAEINATRIRADLLLDDAQTLLERGMTVREVADTLGVAPITINRHLKKNRRYAGLTFG